MNLLIFNKHEQVNQQLKVCAHQHQHIIKVLKSKVGDTLKIGELNGKLGRGKLIRIEKDYSILEIIELDLEPPPQLNLNLLIALPRPQMIKRILQSIATLGVNSVHFIQSQRVEKSFWQSPVLKQEEIHRQLILGLEQGGATQYPQVTMCKRFFPFIRETLPELTANSVCFIAEAGPNPKLPNLEKKGAAYVAIGPEGGFIKEEVDLFIENGFSPISLGQRILKVETAVNIVAAAFI